MAQPIVERASRTLALDDSSSDLMPDKAPRRLDDQAVEAIQDIIIRSKVRAPVLRDSTLPRARLLEWMDQHADDRVRMLAAEAGYGKTTLLADWARRTIRPIRWVKLDPSDAEWASFISYLVAAFQEGSEDFGIATLRLLGHVATLGVTRDQATGQLLAELGGIITEPTVLIIDDVQHVAGNEDIQHIIGRLLERAPQQLTFVLSGRGTPELKLGRLTAQGSVVSLTTEDLRFTRTELGDLFSIGYRMPLEADLLGMVDARTEGWAASLQLLHSSLRGQRKAEIREFIKTLRGTKRPLYDFLAEEVLGHQTPFMQQMLLHASVTERVIPEWVTAAMSVLPDPPDLETVADAVINADELGLMGRNAPGSSSRRFHPLLREFLREHLARSTPPETLRQIHLKVAKIAEEEHWPTAAHHYIEGAEGAEAMRVIGDASVQALGTGALGIALALVDRIPEIDPSPSVLALRARSYTRAGRAVDAVALLRSIDMTSVHLGRDRSVVRLTLANALEATEDREKIAELLKSILDDVGVPSLLNLIAKAWLDMLTSTDSTESRKSMTALIAEADRLDLPLYMGLSRHNLSLILLALGEFSEAASTGQAALELFARADHDEGLSASTMLSVAHSCFELGDTASAVTWVGKGVRTPEAEPDVYAEAACIQIWLGRRRDAAALVVKGAQAIQGRTHPFLAAEAIRASEAWLNLARGKWETAWELAASTPTARFDPNQSALILVLRAAAAVLALRPEQSRLVVEAAALEIASACARRWSPHVALLQAVIDGGDSLADVILAVADTRPSALLAMADVIAVGLNGMASGLEPLERHVRVYAERWRPALRHALLIADGKSGRVTASLLAEIGESEDVAALRDWERKRKKSSRSDALSAKLAKRVSPTLMIRDLGQCSIVLASRQVAIADVRRRAAALLLFLASRPKHLATRDQVFDALWPDQGQAQASNSFHQTLYFLRHELVADKDQDRPLVDYVPVDGELVYLAADLVHIDSAAFCRQAAELAVRNPASSDAASLVQSYEGRFAPEFEYEDWAIGWRDHVHSAFLDLVEQAARARMPDHAPQAAAILRRALSVDPDAWELKPLLAAAMSLSGSTAAAKHLFRQYAMEHEREFGEQPPPLQSVLAEVNTRRAGSGRTPP